MPTVSLDLFYNKQLLAEVKSTILNALLEEARAYAGMPATYSLFEFARENGVRLTEAQHEPIPVVAEDAPEADENVVTAKAYSTSTSNKHLSKAQKRRMWDRGEITGERPRGWNWVDVVRHLSQTGPETL